MGSQNGGVAGRCCASKPPGGRHGVLIELYCYFIGLFNLSDDCRQFKFGLANPVNEADPPWSNRASRSPPFC